MRFVILLTVIFGLAGCATPKIEINAYQGAPLKLAASAVSVVDLTKRDDEFSGWAVGFHRIPDLNFDRRLGEAITTDLTRALVPIGAGEAVEIWVLDAGFYWEKTGADFVPIVNIFSFGRSGRFKCATTINAKRGTQSKRQTIEHILDSIDTSNVGANEVIWKTAARECHPALIEKIVKTLAMRN